MIKNTFNLGHKVTVSCTECLHFVALQMALYLHSVGYTLDVSFYHPAHPFTACFKTLFFSFYIELQISSVYIKTQQQPYSKSTKFRILFLRCINGRKLAKKKPNQICTVESLYIVGKQTSIFMLIYATFNTKSIT